MDHSFDALLPLIFIQAALVASSRLRCSPVVVERAGLTMVCRAVCTSSRSAWYSILHYSSLLGCAIARGRRRNSRVRCLVQS